MADKKEDTNAVTPQDELEQKVFPPFVISEGKAIIDGTATKDFPDCCAVGNEFVGYFCTGTLIAPNLVVTARHCSRDFAITRVFLKGHDVKKPNKGETIEVEKQYKHPSADITALVLKQASTVTPRHVAQGNEVKAEVAIVVGFGTTNLEGTIGYGIKRKAKVPILSLGCNKKGEGELYRCKKNKEMVAGHRGIRRDTCKGDSGGPLYIESDEGPYHLLGLTSRGLQDLDNFPPRPCGNGGIYVRVDRYLDWIEKKTGISIPGPLS
jgi:endonuclease G